MALLYKANAKRGLEWRDWLAAKAPDLPVRLWPETGDPADIRYLVAWQPPEDLESYRNLELVFSVGAGVDNFDMSRLPRHVPFIRMLDPAIAEAMVDYVTLAVMSLHRDLVTYIDQQRRCVWQEREVRRTGDCRIGVLGLGQLGQAVVPRLHSLGFRVAGWSRSARTVAGAECFSGQAELPVFLNSLDILVCLLPLTDETRGILDRKLFAQLPRGASIINVGRGGHLIAADLIEALDTGQLSAAVLDVAEPEPLPPDHPFWAHPKILLTPHTASMTRPETGADFVLETIGRHRRGEPLSGFVDRERVTEDRTKPEAVPHHLDRRSA